MPKTPVIKCKVTSPYVQRMQVDEFTWHVYNVDSGHIVASTYDENMANTILFAIHECGYYTDRYSITESWKAPEPMV